MKNPKRLKRKADDTEPMSQNTMNISGDNFRSSFCQDTANSMDKSQINNIKEMEMSEEKKQQKTAPDTSKFGFEKVEGIDGNN